MAEIYEFLILKDIFVKLLVNHKVSMKVSNFLLILVILLLTGSCSTEQKIKDRLLAVAEDYVSGQLKNPEKKVLKDSTIMIGDTMKRYFIQPSQVYAGLINEDETIDGVVSVTSLEKSGKMLNEHLIIINTGGKYLMVRSVESEMRILSVKNRVITADVPTHPVNNPLHDCPVCREVIKYQFRNGELVKIK
jgi:hypothetical protein